LNDGLFLGSGRDAFRCLLRFGRAKLGWKRLWLPDYFCHVVAASLAQEGLELRRFPDHPERAIRLPEAESNDVVVVVNTFGVRRRIDRRPGAVGWLVEDHSHDPWSDWARSSAADYCVVSLRKTLPIPDGGLLWSPTGRQLPRAPRVSTAHAAAAGAKLQGMILKGAFLSRAMAEKAMFRELLAWGEERMASGPVSSAIRISEAFVCSVDLSGWRRARMRNYRAFVESVESFGDVFHVLPPVTGAVPFAAVVVLKEARCRDPLREWLIERSVYPAVHWPMTRPVGQVSRSSRDLSKRLLTIPCDGRYSIRDMQRVATLLRAFFKSAGGSNCH